MTVGFTLTQDEFEYDIRGLLMAFYPGAEVIQDPQIPVDVMLNVPAFSEKERVARKTAAKRWVYQTLSERTGRTLPWGTLTGIRPTKIASSLLAQGSTPEEAAAAMQRDHLVSPEKSLLAAHIADTERHVLADIDYENGLQPLCGNSVLPDDLPVLLLHLLSA